MKEKTINPQVLNTVTEQLAQLSQVDAHEINITDNLEDDLFLDLEVDLPKVIAKICTALDLEVDREVIADFVAEAHEEPSKATVAELADFIASEFEFS